MRSNEEIKAMIAAMETDIADTPDFNAFGGSNKEDVDEVKSMVAELKLAISGITTEKDTEVGTWLAEKPSMIDHYLEE